PRAFLFAARTCPRPAARRLADAAATPPRRRRSRRPARPLDAARVGLVRPARLRSPPLLRRPSGRLPDAAGVEALPGGPPLPAKRRGAYRLVDLLAARRRRAAGREAGAGLLRGAAVPPAPGAHGQAAPPLPAPHGAEG